MQSLQAVTGMRAGCEDLSTLCRIVHFDLKSANVLLGRDWTAKIADVGLAKILKDGWLSTLREVAPHTYLLRAALRVSLDILLGRKLCPCTRLKGACLRHASDNGTPMW